MGLQWSQLPPGGLEGPAPGKAMGPRRGGPPVSHLLVAKPFWEEVWSGQGKGTNEAEVPPGWEGGEVVRKGPRGLEVEILGAPEQRV